MFASIPSRSFSLFLALLGGLAAIPAGHAAEKAAARGASAPATKPDAILTPAQLQECEKLKVRLRTQTDDALKDKAAIEADKTEIARLNTSLLEERETLDRTSDVAVDAFNAKLGQRDKLTTDYETRVTAYNLKAEAVNATRNSHEKSCVNRRYDDRDLADIKRKK